MADTNILWGTDPEFIILTPEGKWLAPYGDFLEGTCIKPDDVNFEANPNPSTSFKSLLYSVRLEIRRVMMRLGEGFKFSALPVHQLSDEIFKFQHDFGCRPDINLDGVDKGPTREELHEIAKVTTRRPAGGHIQVSGVDIFTSNPLDYVNMVGLFKKFQTEEDVDKRSELEERIRACESFETFRIVTALVEQECLMFSYASSLMYEKWSKLPEGEMERLESERRKIYGQKGAARMKYFTDERRLVLQGAEIRSPSSVWLNLNPTSKAVAIFEKRVNDVIRNPKAFDTKYRDTFPEKKMGVYVEKDFEFSALDYVRPDITTVIGVFDFSKATRDNGKLLTEI